MGSILHIAVSDNLSYIFIQSEWKSRSQSDSILKKSLKNVQ